MTTHCRIVAEEIGLPIEHVNWRHFEECGFQMMTPDGSCNLCVDAYASIAAARKVRRKILEYAVTPTTLIDIEYPPEFPGYKVEDLEIVDGIVRVKADPTVQCPLSEVVKLSLIHI